MASNYLRVYGQLRTDTAQAADRKGLTFKDSLADHSERHSLPGPEAIVSAK